MISLPRLYTVADAAFGHPVELAMALFEGGARLVQLRNKGAASGLILREAEEIVRRAPAGSRVVVNDRADVARLSGAAGVHVGQLDLAPELARISLAPGQIVGRSTHNLEQALEADALDVDYLAAGPVFPTTTKENPDPVIGLDGLREICGRVKHPVVAIGGITLESAPRVFACGAASVAVIGDLLRHGDVAARTRAWLRGVEGMA